MDKFPLNLPSFLLALGAVIVLAIGYGSGDKPAAHAAAKIPAGIFFLDGQP